MAYFKLESLGDIGLNSDPDPNNHVFADYEQDSGRRFEPELSRGFTRSENEPRDRGCPATAWATLSLILPQDAAGTSQDRNVLPRGPRRSTPNGGRPRDCPAWSMSMTLMRPHQLHA